MKIHFLGASRQVTGSRYVLQTDQASLMVDCGMFQEREFLARNWDKCPFPPTELDGLLLTHAHIDHSGLLPRLVAQGFRGPIYCTPATADLAAVLLKDSAEIQQEDAAYKQKRHRKEGRKSKYPVVPLFEMADVEKTLELVRPIAYGQELSLPGVRVVFHDAGHILGSAMLELVVGNGADARRVVFSGDIGQWNKPIIRDPSLLTAGDVVVMESTYGDRDHEPTEDVRTQLKRAILDTCEANGKVIIPTFAVERAQELMYYISQLVHANEIPDIPVFLDSPMAIDVTEIFRAAPRLLR